MFYHVNIASTIFKLYKLEYCDKNNNFLINKNSILWYFLSLSYKTLDFDKNFFYKINSLTSSCAQKN